jgi:hypothetical protein
VQRRRSGGATRRLDETESVYDVGPWKLVARCLDSGGGVPWFQLSARGPGLVRWGGVDTTSPASATPVTGEKELALNNNVALYQGAANVPGGLSNQAFTLTFYSTDDAATVTLNSIADDRSSLGTCIAQGTAVVAE